MNTSPVRSTAPVMQPNLSSGSMNSEFMGGDSGGTEQFQSKPTSWNTKKYREEVDSLKSRLSDHKFNIMKYPDPLVPRTAPLQQPKAMEETEKRLKALIETLKEENRST